MAKAPIWATQFINDVAKYKGRSKLPKFKWVQRHRRSTSGVYYRYSKRITICLGTDENQYRPVILHELAHWLTSGTGHSKRFWLVLRELLIEFDCYSEQYKQREFNYMKKSQYYL